ncbi:MAG: gamma-glutamyltransferase [Bryobacterales bacterium]|nr:gamma-glutamyltransferase [Bryobacterales bacterium]
MLRWNPMPVTQPVPERVWGRNYGRSLVISRQGIVATSHALASQAGAQILARGGSAVDAAITANAVLGVVEPNMDGIGGDLFVLYWEAKTGKLHGLNASGPAPHGLSPQFLASHGITTMPLAGAHTVTVPGAVDGWSKLQQRFGKLAWSQLFSAVIAYADQGFPVTEAIEESWSAPIAVERLLTNSESARVFLPGGEAPRVGQLFRNPDAARCFRLLAEQGPRAFYEGEIAAAILRTLQNLGSTMTASDLAAYSAEWVEPISIDYRGWRVFELPPNGQGMAALEMLNIMETAPPEAGGPSTAGELHKRIEAMKLAYSDVYRYNADPRTNAVPVTTLLSKDHARARATLIDPRKANGSVAPARIAGSDTTYLTVVDREGNIASWIQSIYNSFGSGITVEGMGFPLQNRGAGFTLDPTHPNVLAGGKRPYHTIIPGFMERGGQRIGFGIMGGPNQPLAHAQFVSNVVDYGMNLQEALETPRFTKLAPEGNDVIIESRVPAATRDALTAMGHEITLGREYTQQMGRGQAILHDASTATNYAASDPRADGAATPEPIAAE